MRIYQLSTKSFWLDEIGQASFAIGGFSQALAGAQEHVAAAPLDYLVTSAVAMVDRSDFALRLPAVIWGTLAIYITYLLGTHLGRSQMVGFVAATLLAFTPAHIEYSQELRFYSLFTFLGVTSVWLYIRAVEQSTWQRWLTFGVILTLSGLAHYYTAFIMIILGISTVLIVASGYLPKIPDLGQPRNQHILIPFALASLATVIAVGWWYIRSEVGRESLFSFSAPSLIEVISQPVLGVYFNNEVLGLTILPVLAVIGLIFGVLRKQFWIILVATIPVIGVIGSLTLINFFSYFYSARQLLFVVPFYLIVVASGIVQLSQLLVQRWKLTEALVATATIAIIVLAMPQIQAYYNYSKAQWRDFSAFLTSALSREGAVLTVSTDSRSAGLERYLTYYQPNLRSHIQPYEEVVVNNQVTGNIQRIWVVADQSVRVSPPENWRLITVSNHGLGRFHMHYLGEASDATLWQEVVLFQPPPSLIANSNILSSVARNDIQQALGLANRLLSDFDQQRLILVGSDTASVLTFAARTIFDHSDEKNRALRYLELARQYDPHNTEVYNNLGYAYVREERCDRAIEVMLASPDVNRNYWTNEWLGNAYRCLEQWQNAADRYRLAYTIRATPDMLLAEARTYANLQQPARSRELINELFEKFPDSPIDARAREFLTTLE